jgi:GNAT superfamily N-acetyltransferase
LERALDQQPHLRALQLRGMATAISVQNQGIGALILAAGVDYALSLDADLIWANARDQALNFYNRNGFVTTGEGFIESVTRLPHHRVIKSLK